MGRSDPFEPANSVAATADVSFYAAAGRRYDIMGGDGRCRRARRAQRPRHRMLGTLLERCGKSDARRPIACAQQLNVRQLQAPLGERAGLVENDMGNPRHRFEGVAAHGEDAAASERGSRGSQNGRSRER